MPEDPTGPSIILIGGEITLDSGARLDSRRPLAGDEWDFTLREALGGSEAFWRRAKALTDRILDEHPDRRAWALAWVNKTIKRPKADGSFTRLRSVTLLDNADQLMDKALLRGNATIDASGLTARYRILPYYLRFDDLRGGVDPVVFIGGHHVTYEDGTDIIELAPLEYVLSRWPEAVLVLPHTPLIERKARALLKWHRSGAPAPKRDEYGSIGLAELRQPRKSRRFQAAFEEAADLRGAAPYVIDHDVKISFWVDQGEVRNAADLDAALTFVQSRYDLEIGLWDLARDPVLRMSLLDPAEEPRVASTPAPVPQELAASTAERSAERQAAREREAAARSALHGVIGPSLRREGWVTIPGKKGAEYRLGVGKLQGAPAAGVRRGAAVHFHLVIHKRQAALNMYAWAGFDDVGRFLADHADDIERLTSQRPDPEKNNILRFFGRGWDGSTDGWDGDLGIIRTCVAHLTPRLGDLIDLAHETRDLEKAERRPLEIQVEINVEQQERKAKSSLWTKLLRDR